MHLFIIILFLFFAPIKSYDVPLFYRAQPMFQEPRFERERLTSLDLVLSGGSTNIARNCSGCKVPLGNIYGTNNVKNLAAGYPGLNPSNSLDQILLSLQTLPSRDCFGNLAIDAHFEEFEIIFTGIQNLKRGFFLELLLPIRRIEISNIEFLDLSPVDSIYPNRFTPQWQNFINNLCPILQRFNISTRTLEEFSTGNITFFAGWTKNHENTKHLDFLDTTFKIGLQLPTASPPTVDHLFYISTGYQGFAVPVVWQFAIGAYEWLTLGAQVDGMFLFDQTLPFRIKTAEDQSGIFKIAKSDVKIDQGTAWHIGLYAKADHIVRGLSFLLGYSFDLKDPDKIKKNSLGINPAIVNSDQMLRGWSMSTLHISMDYDFETESNPHGPRLGFVYNRVLAGKRIFFTDLLSGYIGTDFCWEF